MATINTFYVNEIIPAVFSKCHKNNIRYFQAHHEEYSFAFPSKNSGDERKKRLTVYTGPVRVLQETTDLRTF